MREEGRGGVKKGRSRERRGEERGRALRRGESGETGGVKRKKKCRGKERERMERRGEESRGKERRREEKQRQTRKIKKVNQKRARSVTAR